MTNLTSIGALAEDKRWPEIHELLAEGLSTSTLIEKNVLLCELSFFDNLHAVKILIEAGTEVNYRYDLSCGSQIAYTLRAYPSSTPVGQTILGHAHRRFDTAEVLSTLLAAGADVEGKSYSAYTPLQLAIVENCPRHAELLLKAGARVEVAPEKRTNGTDPLDLAKARSKDRPWAMAMLSKYKRSK